MAVGRYFCVAVPFILTAVSIICMLVVGLTGVTSTSLYIFRIDTSNFSFDPNGLADAIGGVQNIGDQISEGIDNLSSRQLDKLIEDVTSGDGNIDQIIDAGQDAGLVDTAADIVTDAQDGTLNNVTAAQLGLGKTYDINLWGYCGTYQDDSHNCTKAAYNWAQGRLNTDAVVALLQATGAQVEIPEQIQQGLDAFISITRWTQIVFCIALVSLGLELLVGLFSACSRGVSCVTWLISGVATVATIAAAAMIAAMAGVVIGTIEAGAGQYGVSASLDRRFMAAIWIAAATAAGASIFWLFSACCCKAERRSFKKNKHADDQEKMLPTGSYQQIGGNHSAGYHGFKPQRGGARSDLAYEPYSHAR